MRQAVTNVLHNAIRYSPAQTTIRVRFEVTAESVTIVIADEGPGIAPEHLSLIFDRFYRVDKARSRANSGPRARLGDCEIVRRATRGTDRR